MTKCLKVPGHSKYRQSTKFPAPTPEPPPNIKPIPFPSIRRLWIGARSFDLRQKSKWQPAQWTKTHSSWGNMLWGCYKLVKRLWRGRKQCFPTIYREGDQLLRINGEICRKRVTDCKRVQGELTEVAGNLRVLFHSRCWKLTELGLRNTPNCTGKFTGTYSKRRTRETKVRDRWRDFATLQSFGI